MFHNLYYVKSQFTLLLYQQKRPVQKPAFKVLKYQLFKLTEFVVDFFHFFIHLKSGINFF
jgi:hypothetical protein